MKTLLVAAGVTALLGGGAAGTYFFVIVPRENPLAEYYVDGSPAGVYTLHLVQNNSTISGTLQEWGPIDGVSAQQIQAAGVASLFDSGGHVISANACGDVCAFEGTESVHGHLSHKNLALDISAPGGGTGTATCVFSVQGNSLIPTPGDQCGQSSSGGSVLGISLSPGAFPNLVNLVASSAQDVTATRNRFLNALPAATKAVQLWNAAQALGKTDYSHLADNLTSVVNNFVTAAASDPCSAANYYSFGWISSAIDSLKSSIAGAATAIKNVQALRDAFTTMAKTDSGASWYVNNTSLMSDVKTQLQSAIDELNNDVTAANRAIGQANQTAPSVFNTAQVAGCVAADFVFHTLVEVGTDLLLGLAA